MTTEHLTLEGAMYIVSTYHTEGLSHDEMKRRGKQMVLKQQLGWEMKNYDSQLQDMRDELPDGTVVYRSSGKRIRLEKNPDGTTKRMTRID